MQPDGLFAVAGAVTCAFALQGSVKDILLDVFD